MILFGGLVVAIDALDTAVDALREPGCLQSDLLAVGVIQVFRQVATSDYILYSSFDMLIFQQAWPVAAIDLFTFEIENRNPIVAAEHVYSLQTFRLDFCYPA